VSEEIGENAAEQAVAMDGLRTIAARHGHMRRAFFFPHGSVAGRRPGGLPGRVPFDIHGPLVSRSGRRDGGATVYADGYEKNTVGSNQDPCVLSSPLDPFHAFCKIDGRRGDLYVREVGTRHDRLLPQVVSADDVIVYGKFNPRGGDGPTTSIWVDTVIVVDEVLRVTTKQPHLPQPCNGRGRCKARPFALAQPWAHQREPLRSVDPNSDAYVYCLSDAAPSGLHCCTRLKDYRIIVGRSEPTPDALVGLRTSFVPIADSAPATVTDVQFDPSSWSSLSNFLDSRVRRGKAGPHGGWIAEFPSFDLAAALCGAVIDAAGEVAIPPLHVTRPCARWDPITGRRIK
jgi:hypothetical protein